MVLGTPRDQLVILLAARMGLQGTAKLPRDLSGPSKGRKLSGMDQTRLDQAGERRKKQKSTSRLEASKLTHEKSKNKDSVRE